MIRAAGRGRTIKRSKFSEAQIAFILRRAEEGTAVGEICRKAGISEATYYNWRKKYAGRRMGSSSKALEKTQQGGPRMGSSSTRARLRFVLDQFKGATSATEE